MKEEYKILGTIRGTRHSIELTKEVKGMPGFAPDYYDLIVGEVVFNFPHDEECVYFQPDSSPPNVWDKEDIEQILEIMNRPFDKENWKDASEKVISGINNTQHFKLG